LTPQASLFARLRATLLAASLATSAALAQAEEGLDLFDEAAFRLSFYYGGISEVHPRELLAEERVALRERCRSAAGCDEAAGLAAIERVIAALNDGHTRLIPPSDFALTQTLLAGGGEADSLGALVTASSKGLGLVVIDVLEGSGAEAAGVRRGDRILQIDGLYLPAHPALRVEAWSAVDLDPERLEVQLMLLRAGSAPLELTLNRQPHELDRPPLLERIGEDVARIWVRSFLPPMEVAPRFFELLAEAERFAHGGLILDLRTNLGGAVSDCMLTASAFGDVAGRVYSGLVEQTILVEDGRLVLIDPSGQRFPQGGIETFVWPYPAVVLVSENSASCAEVAAFAAQRLGVTVIGEETAGVHDTSTAFFSLPNGWGMAISTSTARNLAGEPLPARVTPDIRVDDDPIGLAAGADPMMLRALEFLNDVRSGGR
jgi:carboxyl-terminal processing protease